MIQESPPATGRILSLDVFRGLTILAMIFVNDLAGVSDIPTWLKHAPANADAMTVPDLVFPTFLLIVGMSIPWAIKARSDRGASSFQLWRRILTRALGLLVLGAFMVNAESSGDGQIAGMGIAPWALLMYASIILIWNAYPSAVGTRRWVYVGLRLAGVLILVLLYLLYRNEDGTRMGPRWWGILGLIGWAYVISCALYLTFRRQIPAMIGCLGLLIAFYVGVRSGGLELPGFLAFLQGQAGNASHSAIVVAGIIVSLLFFDDSPARSVRRRVEWLVVFAMLLFAAGFLLRPLHGISKVHATPTWSLYCAGIGILVYVLLYWVVDVKHVVRWTRLLKPAGSNPLLTYILPSVVYFLLSWLHVTILPGRFSQGTLGIIRSCVFTVLMLGLASLLTRCKIRLRL
jgi:heparan-alpha-glucosaminide N-acetyltransferase